MTTGEIAPIPVRGSVLDAVQDGIREYILANGLESGSRLPAEGQLAASFGVARNSVREAVKRLEALGLLESRRGSGVFVRDFSMATFFENVPFSLIFNSNELKHVLDIRRAVEAHYIEEALASIDADTLNRLAVIVDAMGNESGPGPEMLELDRQFHMTIFAQLENDVVVQLLDAFWTPMRRALDHPIVVKSTSADETYKDHLQVLNAIERGDVGAVRAALDNHYLPLLRRLNMLDQLTAT